MRTGSPGADALNTRWRRARLSAVLVAPFCLGACVGMAPKPPASQATPATPTSHAQQLPQGSQATTANNILFRAISLVGTPYRWGGNSPATGFDCSGLVDYVFRTEAGIALPRTSRAIAALDAPKIARQDLQPGDLLFFGRGHRVNHVAIYVGEGRFVNAPNRGGSVRLDELDGYYWRDHYLFAKRILTPRVRAKLATD